MNFTATIHGETFEDRALFEAAALDFRTAKKNAAPRGSKADWNVVKGENADLVARARGTWKAPKAKAFEERVGLEIGARREIALGGDLDPEIVEVEIWSEAPDGGVWAADGERFFWIAKRDGAVYAGLPAFDNYQGRSLPAAA